jgi:hypothetical protein
MNGSSLSSIREPQSARRLHRTFAKSFSVMDVAEPLLSLDANQPAGAAADLMQSQKTESDGLGTGTLGVAVQHAKKAVRLQTQLTP